VMFVYKPGELPEPARFVERWQSMATKAGLGGLYLIAGLGETVYPTHKEDGYDAGVYYQFPFGEDRWVRLRESLTARGYYRGPKRYPYLDSFPEIPAGLQGPVLPCVYPNWDNTPRSGRGGVLATGATPERFGAQVRRALEIARALPEGEQVLVIKSWNEWAEGNYLEPDSDTGHARGDALAGELKRSQG